MDGDDEGTEARDVVISVANGDVDSVLAQREIARDRDRRRGHERCQVIHRQMHARAVARHCARNNIMSCRREFDNTSSFLAPIEYESGSSSAQVSLPCAVTSV